MVKCFPSKCETWVPSLEPTFLKGYVVVQAYSPRTEEIEISRSWSPGLPDQPVMLYSASSKPVKYFQNRWTAPKNNIWGYFLTTTYIWHHTHTRIKLYCLQKTGATGEFILIKQIDPVTNMCFISFVFVRFYIKPHKTRWMYVCSHMYEYNTWLK